MTINSPFSFWFYFHMLLVVASFPTKMIYIILLSYAIFNHGFSNIFCIFIDLSCHFPKSLASSLSSVILFKNSCSYCGIIICQISLSPSILLILEDGWVLYSLTLLFVYLVNFSISPFLHWLHPFYFKLHMWNSFLWCFSQSIIIVFYLFFLFVLLFYFILIVARVWD